MILGTHCNTLGYEIPLKYLTEVNIVRFWIVVCPNITDWPINPLRKHFWGFRAKRPQDKEIFLGFKCNHFGKKMTLRPSYQKLHLCPIRKQVWPKKGSPQRVEIVVLFFDESRLTILPPGEGNVSPRILHSSRSSPFWQ